LPDYSTFLRSCSRSRREVSSCPTRRSSDLGRERERYLFGKFSLRGSSVKVWYTTDEYTQRVLNIPRLFKLARPIVKAGSKLLPLDRKSTRLNSSHVTISYAVLCSNKKIAGQ